MNIQWYPGHMAKTRRMIADTLKICDVVVEIVDARIPISSRNPDINELTSGKPRLVVLNRVDLADPTETKKWSSHFRSQAFGVIETDCKSGRGTDKFALAAKATVKDKLEKYAQKGQNRAVRAMIVGIPNVGKSSLINRLARSKRAKAEDRPGVTRSKQWFYLEGGLELLDTPGILWPKFEDPRTGLMLAFTGAIRDEIIDTETLAAKLLEELSERYFQPVSERLKISEIGRGFEMLEAAGKKRGCMISGGEIDMDRISAIVLDEFRAGKLGHITLETVSMLEEPNDGSI